MKNRPCQRDTACLRADEKKLTDCDFADVDSNAVGVEVADDVDAGGYVDRLVDGLSGNLHAVEAIDLYGNNPFGGGECRESVVALVAGDGQSDLLTLSGLGHLGVDNCRGFDAEGCSFEADAFGGHDGVVL